MPKPPASEPLSPELAVFLRRVLGQKWHLTLRELTNHFKPEPPHGENSLQEWCVEAQRRGFVTPMAAEPPGPHSRVGLTLAGWRALGNEGWPDKCGCCGYDGDDWTFLTRYWGSDYETHHAPDARCGKCWCWNMQGGRLLTSESCRLSRWHDQEILPELSWVDCAAGGVVW